MAMPVVISATPFSAASGTSQSIALPADAQTDDFVIVICSTNNATQTVSTTGWSALCNDQASASYDRLGVFAGKVGGTAVFPATITVGSSVARAGVILLVRHIDTSLAEIPGNRPSGSDPLISFALTPSWGSNDMLSLVAVNKSNGSTGTPSGAPPGYTSLVSVDQSTTTGISYAFMETDVSPVPNAEWVGPVSTAFYMTTHVLIEGALYEIYNKSQDDALGLTDSLTAELLVTHDKSQGDALGLTDALSVVEIDTRTIPDALGLADSLTQVGTSTRTQADSLGLADSLTAVLSVVAEVPDAMGLTDSLDAELVEGLPVIYAAAYAGSAFVRAVAGVQTRTITMPSAYTSDRYLVGIMFRRGSGVTLTATLDGVPVTILDSLTDAMGTWVAWLAKPTGTTAELIWTSTPENLFETGYSAWEVFAEEEPRAVDGMAAQFSPMADVETMAGGFAFSDSVQASSTVPTSDLTITAAGTGGGWSMFRGELFPTIGDNVTLSPPNAQAQGWLQSIGFPPLEIKPNDALGATDSLDRAATYLRHVGGAWVEARRNLCLNPGFEVDLTAWAAATGTGARSVSTDWSASGASSLKVALSSSSSVGDMRSVGGSATSLPWGMQPGKTYTFSAMFNQPEVMTSWSSGATVRQPRLLYFYSVNGTTFTSAFGPRATNTVGPQLLSHTFTVPANATGVILALGAAGSAADVGKVVYYDDVLVEEATEALPYFDGNSTDTADIEYVWVGTAYNSASLELRPPTELLGLTDALSVEFIGGEIDVEVDDDLGLSDVLAVEKSHVRAQADSLGLTDTFTVVESSLRTPADTLGLTDSVTMERSRAITFADVLGLTDSLTVESVEERAIPDAVGLSDALGAIQDTGRAVSDSLGLTDALAVQEAYPRTADDALGLTDALSRVATHARELSDSLGLTDSLVVALIRTRTQADTLGLTDALARTVSATRTPADVLGLTDSLTVIASSSRTLADLLTLTDSLSVELQGIGNQMFTEDIGLTDALDIVRSLGVSRAEILGLTDALTRVFSRARTFAETLGMTDAAVRSLSRPRTQADSLGLTDSLTVTQYFTRSVAVSDTLGLADVAITESAETRALSDGLGLTDSLTTVQFFTIVVTATDTLGLTDMLVYEVVLAPPFPDDLTLTPSGPRVTLAGSAEDPDLTGRADRLTLDGETPRYSLTTNAERLTLEGTR